MKKFVFVIYFLFIPLMVFSQYQEKTGVNIGGSGYIPSTITINTSDGYVTNSKVVITYNSRALDFFKRVIDLGKTLTASQKSWYNDSIFVPLIDSGLIGMTRAGDSLTFLHAYPLKWAVDSSVANMNLLANEFNCIHYGTVIYTDSGIVSPSGNGYLNTFFNPYRDSSITKMLSASLGIYIKSDKYETKYDMGCTNGSTTAFRIISHYTPNTYSTAINYLYGADYSSQTTSLGFFSGRRARYQMMWAFYNGVQLSNNMQYDAVKPNMDLYILCQNNNGTPQAYSTKLVAFDFIGAGLSDTKMRALSNILNNALKGWKYNVY